MKTIYLLILALSITHFITAQNECLADEEGLYHYCASLQIEEVSDDFGITDFFTLLEDQVSPDIFAAFEANLVDVTKAFPEAETPFLQKSIFLYSWTADLQALLLEIPNIVVYSEPWCHEAVSLHIPNDYTAVSSKQSTHLDLVKAPQAWEITKGDGRIKVGISEAENGILDINHIDLVNKIDQVVFNGSGNTTHATLVAGHVAADTDNDVGVASIGYNTEIVYSARTFINSLISLAKIPGVRVINMSWRSCSQSTFAEMAFNEILLIHNVVPVASAGNTSSDCGANAYVWPAAYDDVISVTSVGHSNPYGFTKIPGIGPNNDITQYNWADCHEDIIGAEASTHHHNDKVNICAPGYAVHTTRINDGFGPSWGTSHSAPQVSAACALVTAVNPCLTAVEVKNIVLTTADPSIYQLECNQNYIGLLGTGRLDTYQAVKKALDSGTLHVQNKIYAAGTTTIEFAPTLMYSGYQVTTSLPFGLVTVKENSEVTFQATRSVTLSEGLTVENNATFTVEVIDSPCF